ncbi:cation channel sperm-associated protein subunit beta-like [Gracilinanus agilis]|uniref:cation channel sperm-associated protein subunit beta-like n=1 Tax=Gracilinanus agilis TaxID=191870 RepID=UPI001CFEBCC2|nr:cation channel sperm-associated protein subunit beta-like [Gracilinanus agilis]
MRKPLLYAAVLLWMVPDLLLGKTYTNKGVTTSKLDCSSSKSFLNEAIIKLYLSVGNLEVKCFFMPGIKINENRNETIHLFVSRGLAPSLTVTNSTYAGTFYFNLSLESEIPSWIIKIPREAISRNKGITPVEQWFVTLSLQEGLETFTAEGTLLDLLREPILQWKIGKVLPMKRFFPFLDHVKRIIITRSPCANDVAVVGLKCTSHCLGIYIGVSSSGFWHENDTKWYNATENICVDLDEDCVVSTIIEMILTNHFLVILTSMGLYVSSDLRYPKDQLRFTRVQFCGFDTADFLIAKLWYNERCLANKENFEDDYLAITFEKSRSITQTDTCFYSKDPFKSWKGCIPNAKRARSRRISIRLVSFLIDQEMDTAVYLLRDKKQCYVAVRGLAKGEPKLRMKFPNFMFPQTFYPATGMAFHPRSHFLYVYGNQVWLSYDGGNSFEIVANFENEIIMWSYHSFHTSSIIFLSNSTTLYYSKAGLHSYKKMGQSRFHPVGVYFDHVGSDTLVYLTNSSLDGIAVTVAFSNNSLIQVEEDIKFKTALAPQYITTTQVLFFAYVPKNSPAALSHDLQFRERHVGRRLQLKSIGFAEILKLMTHEEIEGFPSSVLTNLQSPFEIETPTMSPSLASAIRIEKHSNILFKIILTSGKFAFKYLVEFCISDHCIRKYQVPRIKAITGQPYLMDINTRVYWDETDSYTLDLNIVNRYLRKGITSISFVIWQSTVLCDTPVIILTLKSSCSYSKYMSYVPKYAIKREDWDYGQHKDERGFNMIKTLPKNYRPPSNMGIAIPLTNNFYNADPSKPRPRNYHPLSKKTGIYKQCLNKTTREECKCTKEQKDSESIAFSDCKEKVARFLYPVSQYPILLHIKSEELSIPMDIPYLVTISEVNDRKNWNLRQTVKNEMKRMKSHVESLFTDAVYNPNGLKLSITGSELFHFRVKVIPGVTFCNLVDEFQIYVDSAPLPFPGRVLVASLTAVVIGGIILMVFMVELFNINIWVSFKNLFKKKNKVVAEKTTGEQG